MKIEFIARAGVGAQIPLGVVDWPFVPRVHETVVVSGVSGNEYDVRKYIVERVEYAARPEPDAYDPLRLRTGSTYAIRVMLREA